MLNPPHCVYETEKDALEYAIDSLERPARQELELLSAEDLHDLAQACILLASWAEQLLSEIQDG